MDAPLKPPSPYALTAVALSPVIPQLLGSWFNIWYNSKVVGPLLNTPELLGRFHVTVVLYNVLVYPLAIGAWVGVVYSLRATYRVLLAGQTLEAARLECARRRVVHLPWLGAAISGTAWLLGIPAFLIPLALVGSLSTQLLWHLPISFAVSAFISITQSFFIIELASHHRLFPVFFHNARPDQMAGIHPLSLRGRGLMWAISAGICPIGSLLLLAFAPPTLGVNSQWFQVFVGSIGIAFGLASALMISRLVAEPVDQLRAATQAVAEGRLDVRVPLRRADEFGALIGEFNRMVVELGEKVRLRRTFGLHVGRKAAAQILAQDPGLGGVERVITVMFVDIRDFTARASTSDPQRVVAVLNEFLREMVQVVDEHPSGMVNKYLGDGFMALFGAGLPSARHADEALHAAQGMLTRLTELNAHLATRDEAPLAIGIGLHTGPAIVGSIGSPARLEFTAIGHTVNLASRIETLTKTTGSPLVLSDATRAALHSSESLRELPPQTVKGVPGPLRVWAPQS